jgi:hypothetical protein
VAEDILDRLNARRARVRAETGEQPENRRTLKARNCPSVTGHIGEMKER